MDINTYKEGYSLLQSATDVEVPRKPSKAVEQHEQIIARHLHNREDEDEELFNKSLADETKILFFPKGQFIFQSLMLLVLIILNVTGTIRHAMSLIPQLSSSIQRIPT
jgi:uncharacterized membrane protein